MEKLTDDLVQGATELINQVESEGGMTAAIESGMAKLMIEESAAKKQVRGRREDRGAVALAWLLLAPLTLVGCCAGARGCWH